MIYIYTDSITERLIFTLDFIFSESGVKYDLINDLNRFHKLKGNKICYSDYEVEDTYQIYPANLLFEEVIDLRIETKLLKQNWQGIDLLSFNRKPDILASIFYCISDYTNYLEKDLDEHDRVSAKNAIQHKYGWLDKVMADRWAKHLIDLLKKEGFSINYVKPKVSLTPSFDIDNTFAYKLKDGFRGFASKAKDILKGDSARKIERQYVLAGDKKDPYDTFDYIIGLKKRGLKPILFYLLGDYTKYDRNIAFDDPRHQKHILNISRELDINLHPSYKSNDSLKQLSEEKDRLEKIIAKPVFKSRQHFLKVYNPQTYTNLIKLGFKEDYTSGYADSYGFRLGTAKQIDFFDLTKNQRTDYKLNPFAYMDGTLNQYLNLDIEQAKQVVAQLLHEVVTYGGNFISVWHNETIGDYGIWKGWREVHEFMIAEFERLNHEKN